MPGLPLTMQAADHRAHQYERAIIDLIEALLLAARVVETFEGTIIATNGDSAGPGRNAAAAFHTGIVMLRNIAIKARVVSSAALLLGASVRVKLTEADPSQRTTCFELVQAGS